MPQYIVFWIPGGKPLNRAEIEARLKHLPFYSELTLNISPDQTEASLSGIPNRKRRFVVEAIGIKYQVLQGKQLRGDGRNHGGHRQNAGRKPTHGPMVSVSVRLTKPEHARLQAVRAQGLTCRQVLMQGVETHELQ